MPLTQRQVVVLEESIVNYSFPTIYFDFVKNLRVDAGSMIALEGVVSKMLLSPIQQQVLYGLANVIYWGYANAGYQRYRVDKFLGDVRACQVERFQFMVASGRIPSLQQIKDLGMPHYSGVSFISKILAFLDPAKFCVLDLLLARLGNVPGVKAINRLKSTTQIRVTASNSDAYQKWCDECQAISGRYYSGKYRVVDIERGFFNLIQNRRLAAAQVIYHDA